MVCLVCGSSTMKSARRPAYLVLVLLLLLGSPLYAQDSLVLLYNNLGVIHAGNDDLDLARAYLDSAREIDPTNAAVLNNLANCCLCQGRIGDALRLYGAANAADTTDNTKLFNWSVGLYVADSIEQSIQVMRKFLDYTIDHPEARGFSASLTPMIDSLKGDANRVNKAEIERLLAKARQRMKSVADTSLTKKPEDTTAVSKLPREVVVIPAGSKSAELSHLTRILYWIVL